MLLLASLAIDASNIYLQNQRMQIAADAAALGGARKVAIEADENSIDDEIHELASENDADDVAWRYTEDERGVFVTVTRTFPSNFAFIAGYESFTVQAQAEARYQPVSVTDNLFPITFDCGCWENGETIRIENAPPPTPTPTPVTTCTGSACLVASPRLLSLNTGESALLNPLLQGLLGVNLNVNVVDWNGLVNLDITLGELQSALGIATPSQLLATPLTLGQLLSALNTALPTGLPGSLSSIIVKLPAGTILLGDLLDIDPSVEAYSNIELNALDFVTAAFELFNYQNVVNSEVQINLPVNGVAANGLRLKVKVITPPVFVCGDVGTTFHSAAIRLGLRVSLADILRSVNVGLASISITLTQLDLYLEVASGTGLLSAIDAINQTVTVQATPSVANLYVGRLADNAFFQAAPINPATDLLHSTVGRAEVKLLSILGITLLSTQADLGLKLTAEGSSATTQQLYFTGFGAGNYPETKTATAGAQSLNSLLATLVGSISAPNAVQAQLSLSVLNAINIELGNVINLITGLLGNLLDPVGGVVYTILSNVLIHVLDPLLNLLGVGIGEMDVTVVGMHIECVTVLDGEVEGGGDDDDSEAVTCPFEWVDWNGLAASNLEVAGYIQNVSQSGPRAIGSILETGPEVQYSPSVDAALDERIGTILRIPLTYLSNEVRFVCGFANVILVDHDLDEGWIDIRIVSELIPAIESDPDSPDFGARDIRLTR